MKMLTVGELWDRRKARAKINHETYKLIYGMAVNAVRSTESVRPPVTGTTYTIPSFMAFRPMYNRDHAVRYVADKLRLGGFKVTVRERYHLDIDWTRSAPSKKKKKKKKKKEKPLETMSIDDKMKKAQELMIKFKSKP